MMVRLLFIVVVLHYISIDINGLENGLARTPPMGWMSWTRFFCEIDCKQHPFGCIDEYLYKSQADRLAHDGYAKVGYDRVHIDDCWAEKKRDKDGRMVPDKERFRSGMNALAKYMHDLGLKFGSYGDYGNSTCAGYPGSQDYEKIDAYTFAEWEIDYIKLDGCWSSDTDYFKGYPLFGKYLNQTGRPIVYSCSWPAYLNSNESEKPYDVIVKHCNLWRNYGDISSSWESLFSIIKYYVEQQDFLITIHGPGHWNDPDMLIVGNPGVSLGASRVQMAVWSIWSAPLIMSNDLRIIPPEFAALLKNEKIIAVDQDPLGIMGRMIKQTDQLYYFAKKMTPVETDHEGHEKYSYAICIVNFSKDVAKVSTKLGEFGLTSRAYKVEDLFEDSPIGTLSPEKSLTWTIPPRDAVFLKATILPTFQNKKFNEINF